MSPWLFAAFALADGPFGGLEHSRTPPRIESFWDGLAPAAATSNRGGVVALRQPLDHRVRITGGRFVMGSTNGEMQDAIRLCEREPLGDKVMCSESTNFGSISLWIRSEGLTHEVFLSDFEIDMTEVTVERYARCVAAGQCAAPGFIQGDARYDQPTFPVTHVRWDDAVDFCHWVGARLPTEAEWELAARGHDNRTFPWGNIYNPHLANHGALAEDPLDGRDGFVGLAPVGSFPDGATESGLLDMAGNAEEWVSDWYDRDQDQFGYSGAAVTNPKGPAFGPFGHVVRGGSYRDAAFWLRTAARHASSSMERDIGFRCAADLR